MIQNIDSLQKESEDNQALEESFNSNPIKKAIQDLFSHEFSGDKYKKYSEKEFFEIIDNKLNKAVQDKPKYLKDLQRHNIKLKSCQSIVEALEVLNYILFDE